jgi:hypothetical protein
MYTLVNKYEAIMCTSVINLNYPSVHNNSQNSQSQSQQTPVEDDIPKVLGDGEEEDDNMGEEADPRHHHGRRRGQHQPIGH